MILSIVSAPVAYADTIIMADQSSRTTILSPDDNTSNSAKLSVRSDGSSNKSWVKFNLGALDVGSLKTATLTITLHNPKSGARTFDVSYVNDDCIDNIDWEEGTITWNSAPGNDTADLGALDPGKTTLLTTVDFTDGVPGDAFTIDVLGALEADTDGIVQFVIHNSSGLLDFATHDHTEETWRPFISVTEGVKAQAKKPHPDNGMTDVPHDIVLTWTPGAYAPAANGHNVYFSDSFDDVNDGVALVSPSQNANSYDPGPLEFGATYFWRVDEVNAAPDATVFPGNIWSFTVESFAYPVENITATASSTQAGSAPENTIDGSGLDVDDLHSDDVDTMWLTAPDGTSPAWIQYEFDRVYKLYEMMVWNYNVQFEVALGYGFKDVTIEYSPDGVDWAVLAEVEFAKGPSAAGYASNTTVDMGGVAARYIRLTANSSYGMLGQYGLSEVRFMYIPAQAREPEPADEATDVSVNTSLTWRAGRDAVSHEVYFGTDPEALALADTVSGNSYAPGALDLATTYYWQVTAVQDTESWAGGLWNFTTQEYLVVDDFESYDDEDNRIYNTWLDGWVNDTGSTVGHLESPFAEQTIVNSGRQSMPLAYDNTGVVTSETDFDLAQNWTESGVQSLSLSVYGDAANSGGQLYVMINNTKVSDDAAVIDLTAASWQTWSIDLSTVGNVSSVNSLTIGIEGAGASGILYVDDIRLHP